MTSDVSLILILGGMEGGFGSQKGICLESQISEGDLSTELLTITCH